MDLRLRLRNTGDRTRESLWVVPGLAVAGGLAAGAGLGRTNAGATALDGVLFLGSADAARTILSALLTGLITAASVVFSLTLVAIQTAGTNYSPRLLRNFVRDRGTQAVLAILLGTTAYVLGALHDVRGEQGAPRLAVSLAMLLTLVSVLAIAWFINHIAQAVRVESVLRGVGQETRGTIARFLASGSAGRPVHGTDAAPAVLPDPPATGVQVVPAKAHGYLTDVDLPALTEYAARHSVTIRIQAQRGDYVIPGEPLAWVWPTPDDPNKAVQLVREAVSLTFERTLREDVAFGLRQVVDLAIKAISPAVNDPYSAVQAIDHLALLLGRLAGHRLGPQLVRADDGRLLVAVPAPDFSAYLALACDQIRRYGAKEPTVVARLLRLCRDLGAVAGREHRHALHAQVGVILAAAEAEIGMDDDLVVLRAGAAEAHQWIDGDVRPAAPATALEL